MSKAIEPLYITYFRKEKEEIIKEFFKKNKVYKTISKKDIESLREKLKNHVFHSIKWGGDEKKQKIISISNVFLPRISKYSWGLILQVSLFDYESEIVVQFDFDFEW